MLTDTATNRGAQDLVEALKLKATAQLLAVGINLGDVEARIAADQALSFLGLLRNDPDFQFDFLVSVTAVDYLDHDFLPRAEQGRFEVVYHLLSLAKFQRLRVKVSLPEGAPEIESVSALWPGANFMEREVWDMFGITFKNHPDLRRVLMYKEFVGHPLRKDYPVQGKQPRIPLRHAEVQNTSRDMRREPLVGIGRAGAQCSKTAGGES